MPENYKDRPKLRKRTGKFHEFFRKPHEYPYTFEDFLNTTSEINPSMLERAGNETLIALCVELKAKELKRYVIHHTLLNKIQEKLEEIHDQIEAANASNLSADLKKSLAHTLELQVKLLESFFTNK